MLPQTTQRSHEAAIELAEIAWPGFDTHGQNFTETSLEQ